MSEEFASLIARYSLVISCQAPIGSPLRDSTIMAAMARAGELGGARGVRANGIEDIRAIREEVSLPIIGIEKFRTATGVFITPTADHALALEAAGASIVGIDATLRKRPDGSSFAEQLKSVRSRSGIVIMADVDSLEAGIAARRAGADAVATTLSGYTGTPGGEGPDLDLITQLSDVLDCPVVAEGRIRDTQDLKAVFRAGAYAAVVGSALTNPLDTTARFVSAIDSQTYAPPES